MRNRPWSIAQYAIAALLLGISLLGILGTFLFDAAELTFTFTGAIQAFGVFPGLVLSLVLNGSLMRMRREPAPGTAQRALLIVEFVLIAALLVFHFFLDNDGYTFWLAVATWPLVIILGVTLAILAVARLATAAPETAAGPPPAAAPPAA